MKTKRKALVTVLFLGMFLPGCKSNFKENGNLTGLEQKLFSLVNSHRQTNGLTPLQWNATIAEVCRNHCQEMAAGTSPFSHAGFEARLAELGQSIGWIAAGENLARVTGYSQPAEEVFNNWLDSPDHLADVNGDYNLSGVGVAKNDNDIYFFSQIFIKTQ